MHPDLRTFLTFYLPFEDLDPFLERFNRVTISEGKHWLKPGMDCRYLAYVQEGLFRVYHLDLNLREINTWFSFPGMAITDMLGFYSTGIARFYVEAMEDSVIYKISQADLHDLYTRYPAYQAFGRKFAEEALTMLMERTLSLHTKTAEERYRELLEKPGFLQKIPLKHLASYLGVTDSSLSRIRRNI